MKTFKAGLVGVSLFVMGLVGKFVIFAARNKKRLKYIQNEQSEVYAARCFGIQGGCAQRYQEH